MLTLNIDEDEPLLQKADAPLGRASLAEISRNRAESSPFFAASIDFSSQSMNFATLGIFCADLLESLGSDGDDRYCRARYDGNATLHSASDMVVCDSALWGWLSDRPGAIENLHSALDREMPPGLASIITLD